MVALYHILFYSQLYLRCPKSRRVFFFLSLSKSVATEYFYCDKIPVSLAPLSCVHPSCTCMPVVRTQLCRGRQSISVVRSRAPLTRALCLIATSLLLAQCPFPVATQMNSVATWDLLTITELCRNLKFSCRDLVSITYTSLCRDKEKSCRIESSFLACRDRIPRRARTYVVRAQGLSCAPSLICCVCMASSATTQRGIAL